MSDTRRILVVDDDRTTRVLIAKLLGGEGYQVVTTDRSEKCLFLAFEQNFDAFLIDINMPGLDGIKLCRRIRVIERFKIVPIIFISALDEDTNLNEAFNVGATDFISKPINPTILRVRLKAHIEKVNYVNEIEKTRRYLNRYISVRTQRMVEAYSLTGSLPSPERHNVSVMFTDIRGFTHISQHIDLEELFTQVSTHLGKQVKLVHEHGGYIDKFGGDGLMAIFDHEDSAIRACHCGLDILKIYRKESKGLDQLTLPVGIGIHHGPVLIGNIGSEEHLDYSALGETVILAERLCSHAESMHIDVSDEVVSIAKHDKRLQFIGPVSTSIKGFDKEILVYHVEYLS